MTAAKFDTRHFDQKMINYCIKQHKNITEKGGDNIQLQNIDHRDFSKSPKTSLKKLIENQFDTENHRDITVNIIFLLKSLTLSPSKKGESGDNWFW